MQQLSSRSESRAAGGAGLAVRPRTALELVDAAVVLGRRHYAALLTLCALAIVATGPIYVSYALLGDGVLPFGIPSAVADVYETVVGCLLGGALVVAASDAYLGRRPDLARSIRESWRQAWPLTVTCVLVMVLTFAGLILLIAPGLYALVRLFAVTPAVVLERRGALDAFRRSAALSRGSGRKILATAGAAMLALIIATLVLVALVSWWTGSEASASFLTSVVFSVVWPFFYALVTLVYYDARIVREGFDVQLMAEALEGRDSAPRDDATA